MDWKWYICVMILVSCMYGIHKEYDGESSAISLVLALVVNCWATINLAKWFLNYTMNLEDRRIQELHQASVGGSPFLMQLTRQAPTTPDGIRRSILKFLIPELTQIVSSYTTPAYPFLQHPDFRYVLQHFIEYCAKYKCDPEKFESVIHSPEMGTIARKRDQKGTLFDLGDVLRRTFTSPSAHLILFEYRNRLGSVCVSTNHSPNNLFGDDAEQQLSFRYASRQPTYTRSTCYLHRFAIDYNYVVSVDRHLYTVTLNSSEGLCHLPCFAFRSKLPCFPTVVAL